MAVAVVVSAVDSRAARVPVVAAAEAGPVAVTRPAAASRG